MKASRTAGRTRWWIGIAAVVLVLAGTAAYVLSLPQFGAKLAGERLARAQASPLYRDGKFANPLPPAGYRAEDVWNLVRGSSATSCACRRPPCPCLRSTPRR